MRRVKRKAEQNADIRAEITKHGLFDFQVAKRLEITPEELREWMSEELTQDRRDKILNAMRERR